MNTFGSQKSTKFTVLEFLTINGSFTDCIITDKSIAVSKLFNHGQ